MRLLRLGRTTFCMRAQITLYCLFIGRIAIEGDREGNREGFIVNTAYITATGTYLPGEPVSNNEMVDHLGRIDDQSERLGRLILRQNKIQTRYYVEREGAAYRETNADLAANAAKALLLKSGINADEIDLLATATTQGDLIVPGHASAVHAALAKQTTMGALEVASFQSVCASSIMATKAAALNIQAGQMTRTLAIGSEFSSRWFQPGFYQYVDIFDDKETRMAAEFLRWTLSDGAGAILLEDKPSNQHQSFRIDWINLVSLADRFDTCMYAGINPADQFSLKQPWSHYQGGPANATQEGAIMLLQDMALLKRIIRAWVGEYLSCIDEGKINPDNVDHLLCHYSAHSLREEIISILKTTGGMIDEEKWFTNLSTKGNTGAAALFIMLDEFAEKQIAKPGDKVLCIVPESGRAMVGFIMLTAQ